MNRPLPKNGEIYRHFKNKLYQIVTIAHHSESGEQLVVYQALYGDFSCCARPLAMFMSEVDKEKYPDVLQQYRFELVDKTTLEPLHIKDSSVNEVINKTSNTSNDESNNIINEKNDENYEESYEDGNEEINPDLLAFLEAETYEEKRNLLVSMRQRLDDYLINSIAISMDVVVDDGDIDTRYKSLLNCISTMGKYEITNRLR